MPPASPRPLLCAVLFTLRELGGWTAEMLAEKAGVSPKTIWTWETKKPPEREKLEWVVGLMGYEPEAIDALAFGLKGAVERSAEPLSPVDPSAALLGRIRRVAARTALAQMELIERHLVKLVRAFRARKARRKARRLWARLQGASADQRRLLVEKSREFQTWGLAELLGHKSAEAASDRADRALELAALARRVAELAPGSEEWRSRLRGYTLAFLGNARRVASDLDGAEEAFARAWTLWEAGAAADPGLLAEWRLFDLEASLHRGRRRFAEAEARLEEAQALAPQEAKGRILLKKAFTLQQKGEPERAIGALQEAAPFVDGRREPHRRFALRFNWVSCLCDLERFSEAEALLPEVRGLALALRNDLDILRTVWLGARVLAGLGRNAEARETFERVRREFNAREMDYDYALVSLDLAALLLGLGCTGEVVGLAEEMVRIFNRQEIHREALGALSLFRKAVRKEEATVELARRLIAYLTQVRSDPRLRFEA